MPDTWTSRWDERYSTEEFAYGVLPNTYLKEQLDLLSPGKILFAAEGEGRNAVYAAKQGWTVSAFDISIAGQQKALKLADTNKVTLDYRVGELPALGFAPAQFDALALIYAHFPASIKSAYHQQLSRYLRPGGVVIFEAFSKNHLAYLARNEKVGGPKDVESLFSPEEIQADFAGYDVLELTEQEVELTEGLYHNGLGSVIRFVGRKK
ncbi:class I SAM-dependent methyltransferase [Hymenobacter cellulosilyticus]|uniref:Methyltransferase domain-containing protein n=1 Tax=Hymenobacter cellulosilyticus TaxID=2932248 RepID=A0A8T9Q954_9BACT|nr:class I SAM-dependent methyltransferase [Hymenobacter cellulosilyticus]UOQ74044.1 methyltransferase domain-containing protein [Hymenobacter cellulosilyticus]